MEKNYYDHQIPKLTELYELINKIDDINVTYNFYDLFEKRGEEYFIKKDFIDNKFISNSKSKSNLKEYDNLMGLYVFMKEKEPVYIGISKNIISRIKQHFCYKTHNSASLVYLIARSEYDKKKYYDGERKHFPFEEYRKTIQKDMRENWKIAIIPESNPYLLYFKEILYAINYQTYWNSFETH